MTGPRSTSRSIFSKWLVVVHGQQGFELRSLDVCALRRARLSRPFSLLSPFHLPFDEVDNTCLQFYAVKGIDFLDAGWTGNIHFGEIVSDNIEPNEVQSFLPQARTYFAANLVIARGDVGLYARPAHVDIPTMFIGAGDPEGTT